MIRTRRGRLAAIALLAGACCHGGIARAAEPLQEGGAPFVRAADAATTRPSGEGATSDEQVLKGLVAELGNENPKTRMRAAAILRKMGSDALPALELGTKDADAQVRASSQGLIDQIRNPQKYEPQPGGYAVQADRIRIMRTVPLRLQAGVNLMAVQHNGRREVSVMEPGRTVHIREDNDGIRMTVQSGGKVDQYQAANPDELKRTAPDAFQLYQQYGR